MGSHSKSILARNFAIHAMRNLVGTRNTCRFLQGHLCSDRWPTIPLLAMAIWHGRPLMKSEWPPVPGRWIKL